MGFWDSIGHDLGGRGIFGGGFQLRLILQPLLAMLLGIRFGIRDAKQGKAPFFTALQQGKSERRKILGQAARDAIVPLVIALVLDSVLQHMINGRVRPLAAVIVGCLLVFLPFLLVRALANRAWTHGHLRDERQAQR